MKKIFLNILLLFLTTQFVFAEVMPYYTSSIKRTGIGLTSVKSPLILRQEPNEKGKILETLNFDFKTQPTCLTNKTRCELDDIFVVYKEDKKTAFLSTLDETDGWDLVCFNQAQTPICGWVKDGQNKYYTWVEFFNQFGKNNGLYMFKDIQKQDKLLYSAPVKQTNSTGSIEMAKFISPWLVQGNWILVKVNDFGNQAKTGWLNYRSDSGKLKAFPRF